MPVLNQALLDEKNEEIDYLTEQLARLEEQLANSSAQHEVDRLVSAHTLLGNLAYIYGPLFFVLIISFRDI